METAKAELKRLYGYDDDQLVMIPVKYDLKELWQWTLVLDRFAVSSGNTIGITGAEGRPESQGYRSVSDCISSGEVCRR